jgi:hypothetical protein
VAGHTHGETARLRHADARGVYRNYFAPVENQHGQTAQRQIDGLAELGTALSSALDKPISALWRMQNGYALCTQSGLEAIAEHLKALTPEQLDVLRGKLCIGIHRDVEVTGAAEDHRPVVSQAFCSALPVAYTRAPSSYWAALPNWFWKQLMKRLCGPRCSRHSAAHQTVFF